ncbi:hypothetical protein [Luteipulveratus halotolerans]|uniref:Membrane protein n=1 Tax=Luteipulveratus halotolerans TaxID=1631356 RepID=A0A0L6CHG4_9MICO|nr:hypothetical protein [Luteipulveratus halotolerans]KNX37247.1 membrane protein [Luteipulveratus halotolerans]
MLVALIAVCEVLFWVLILLGLAARYLAHRRRLSTALLVSAPLVDLVLLGAAVVDLRHGGTATPAHALAAIYLGVSVGFGHRLIRWADGRFAHRFGGAAPPPPTPRYGRAHAVAQLQDWLRHLCAWAVGCALMGAAVLVIGDAGRTSALTQTTQIWTLVLVIDGAISVSYSFSPRKPRSSSSLRADRTCLLRTSYA